MKVPAGLLERSPAFAAAAVLGRLALPHGDRLVHLPRANRVEVGPRADLYVPDLGRASPGVVLVLGALREGRRYELLETTARALAGCGYAVLVPELGRLSRLILGPDALDDLVDATRSMASLPGVRNGPVGLFGFSLGASLALVAAGDQRLEGGVACVAAMGGYHRLDDMLAAATTGAVALESPSVYAVCASLAALLAEPDRSLFERALDENRDSPLEALTRLAATPTGAEARALIALLKNRDATAVPAVIGRINGAAAAMSALSPATVLDRIVVPVFVLHDERDRYVPFSQHVLMREAMKGRRNFRFFSTRLLEHTEPAAPRSISALVEDYVPGLWQLERFVRGPLAALRATPRSR